MQLVLLAQTDPACSTVDRSRPLDIRERVIIMGKLDRAAGPGTGETRRTRPPGARLPRVRRSSVTRRQGVTTTVMRVLAERPLDCPNGPGVTNLRRRIRHRHRI